MSTNIATTHTPLNKFTWLLKREFWENRGGILRAPFITALVVIAITIMGLTTAEFTAHRSGVNISGMNLDRITQNISEGDAAKAHAAVDLGLLGMSLPIGIVFCFVVFFYLLGALYNDRRDRSVLFWKSLPLSDTETVLAKVATAALIAPVFAIAAIIALHIGFLILLTAFTLLHGAGAAALPLLWSPAHLMALWTKMIVMIPVNALWALPTIGWLLLCSSFARSKPFLWAFVMPILVGWAIAWVHLSQSLSIPSGWYWKHIFGRLLFSIIPYGWIGHSEISDNDIQATFGHGSGDPGEMLDKLASFGSIADALAQPELWIGAAAGAAMIAGAIWFRRQRIESYA